MSGKMLCMVCSILALSAAFSSIAGAADPNLVGWWKFDEGSGTVAIDSSGNGCNGTINGGATWGVGSPYDNSRYLLFDGANDYVDVNYIPQGKFLFSNYTIAMWFRVDGGSGQRDLFGATNNVGDHGILLEHGHGQAPNGIRYINRSPFAPGGMGTPEEIYSPSTVIVNDGQWHHIAAVRASDTSRLLYVDGVQVGSNINNLPAFTAPARIALGVCKYSWLTRWWNGGIDDVRIYNRALSLAEITQLAGSPLASSPRPADGEKDVSTDPVLSWKPGVNANSHNVYFGANSSDVNNATMTSHPNVTVASISVSSYKPGTLQFNTTYYWRVDEVKGVNISKGDVWDFTTGKYLIVDDMESYGTADTPGPPPPSGSRMWFTWKDGAGWTTPSQVVGNGTGSVVDPNSGIVHKGNQSLKLFYDNDGFNVFGDGNKKYYSEIKADTSYLTIGRDWTKSGIKALTLWFYGNGQNSAGANEQMYVKLNGAKVLYDGDMNDVKQASWHEWNIDLAKFGIALANVTDIAIGFGNETNTKQGGAGIVYLDDILLYQPRCILSKRSANFAKLDYAPAAFPASGDCAINYGELDIMMNDWLSADYVTEPTTNPALAGGLVAYYPLDEGTGTTTADKSGNGHDGTLGAGVTWVTPGLAGSSAIDVNGGPGARVSIGAWDPVGPGGMTLSIWTRWLGSNGRSQGLICKRDGWGSSDVLRFMFEIFPNAALRLGQYGDNNAYSPADTMTPYIGKWAHIAVTFDGTTARFYLNGREIASGPFTLGTMTGATMTIGNTQSSIAWADSPEAYNGDLDEARIYDRALSPAEVAYLADITPADGKLHVPVQSPAELYDTEPQGLQRINFMDFATLMVHWLEEQLWP
jgi:hypothetical protein